jgi:hypothetical protein
MAPSGAIFFAKKRYKCLTLFMPKCANTFSLDHSSAGQSVIDIFNPSMKIHIPFLISRFH